MTAVDHAAHDRLLAAVAEETRAAVLERYGEDSCIGTTRAVLEVLRYHGVAARPWACRVKVFNAAAWELVRAGAPVAEWPPGAWSVSIDDRNPGPPGAPGVGHLVAVTATRRLVDASIDQASRPAKGIVLEPGVALVPAGFDLAGEEELLYDVGGVRVIYGPSPSRAYLSSPNWGARDRAVRREIVAQAVRAVRARPDVSGRRYRQEAGAPRHPGDA